MPADPNQKLYSQMVDLGRNISTLTDAIKKNTSSNKESEKESKDKPQTGNTPAQTGAPIDNKKIVDSLDSLNKSIQDLQKTITSSIKQQGNPVDNQQAKNAAGSAQEKKPTDFSKIAGGIGKAIGGADRFKKIIGKFKDGGIAPKTGEYLVGENGPEIVTLPKDSGVIPLNIKDFENFIKNISEVPELADLAKSKDKPKVWANRVSPSVLITDGKSLDIEDLKYDYYDRESEDKEDQGLIDKRIGVIDSLLSMMDETTESAFQSLKTQKEELSAKLKDANKDLPESEKYTNGMSFKDEDQIEIYKNKILEGTGMYQLSDLSYEKARVAALKMVLDKKENDAKLKKEETDLKDIKNLPNELVSPKIEKVKGDKKESEGGEKKEGLFSKFKKDDKKKEGSEGDTEKKSEGIFSKMGLNKKKSPEGEGEGEEKKEGSKKAAAVLGKVGAIGEKLALGAASKALGGGTSAALLQLGVKGLKKGIASYKDKNKEEKEGETPKSGKTDGAENKITTGNLQKPEKVSEVKKLSTPQKKEQPKSETPADSSGKQSPTPSSPKTETSKQSGSSPSKPTESKTPTSKSEASSGMSDKDIQDIKNSLSRIASILEGPLTVSPIDQPFRPDSRRV